MIHIVRTFFWGDVYVLNCIKMIIDYLLIRMTTTTTTITISFITISHIINITTTITSIMISVFWFISFVDIVSLFTSQLLEKLYELDTTESNYVFIMIDDD